METVVYLCLQAGAMAHSIQIVASIILSWHNSSRYTIILLIILQEVKPPRASAVVPKEKRIVPEDYFRVLKQQKEADPKKHDNGKVSAISQSRQEGDESKHIPEKFGMPHWLSLIDPEMDDEEALSFIELPQETIYLIDKVVRQKARAGPIGIDNSEFINIEIEEEFKEKNTHI